MGSHCFFWHLASVETAVVASLCGFYAPCQFSANPRWRICYFCNEQAAAELDGFAVDAQAVLDVRLDGTDSEKDAFGIRKLDFLKDGYRFYQSSYDQDRQGSILSVNYDP